ncbi:MULTISPECIES: hypothetical protein [unclassified Streptomyces]|uniref:hypothetical protein n=1 Tax=unclassified Streptomyces TaxID=2593676 RepID=UPI0022567B7F|nr:MULTISPECIES: hypothetical protein [unclassified Streptomyces]MCX5141692.1 hypothetical protein [Streptomyces sp. NBC_00338]WRZ66201.1 hypothetical protein OG408_21065 [Streptomyces sp. NBC_01257]WSU60194.1 hypothetical protein OG450_21225 [Streptomyces sp. NBC_01104]
MPKPAVSPEPPTQPAPPPAPLPFLLTTRQGEAARELLSYVAGLPLTSVDAQLLAVVVAIRAARTGLGNLTGTDLRSLRLDDPQGAVAELIAAGWQVPGSLLDGDPDKPAGIIVPEMSPGPGHVLPLGKGVRSKVSGWAMRTRIAKPVKKTPPAARLAALFLAAYCTEELVGEAPAELPVACYGAVPVLLDKGFLTEISGRTYRLGPAVRHLAGMFRTPEEVAAQEAEEAERRAVREAAAAEELVEVTPEQWAAWKSGISPALLRHVEAVEQCAVCRCSFGRVARAFMSSPTPVPAPRPVAGDHEVWRDAHPECGREAAEFTLAFRAEHGHGPSYGQLCKGLGWKKLSRSLRGLVVGGILADGWLTDTSPVPWTLRPGKTAQAQGIALPGQTARGRG